ncbi:hypothetical protein CHU93_06580 [Sandarakinorhabdus cyanobacteriorum]|uniref:Uncharacterized protein n=1 Tax=Sandarakinorhabdus cyanobacteriorum TaxID=1981098 RepID=A0A255YN31_9SPHN|nr:hypothetical protein [Sandarakinorhabdus cyanobacteriorum]OYQ30666.1 hypothetical protein CHU93_06580 [Sandarakinorhabdus cyanobacteriorum]
MRRAAVSGSAVAVPVVIRRLLPMLAPFVLAACQEVRKPAIEVEDTPAENQGLGRLPEANARFTDLPPLRHPTRGRPQARRQRRRPSAELAFGSAQNGPFSSTMARLSMAAKLTQAQ